VGRAEARPSEQKFFARSRNFWRVPGFPLAQGGDKKTTPEKEEKENK
jgi:hypothetical protein